MSILLDRLNHRSYYHRALRNKGESFRRLLVADDGRDGRRCIERGYAHGSLRRGVIQRGL